jgi:hypothetical protein
MEIKMKAKSNLLLFVVLSILSINALGSNYIPAGGYGVYGLNTHPDQLKVLYRDYLVRNIDAGYLFIKKGSDCTFANISDGSVVNPVTAHVKEFKDFTDLNGTTLSFTIGGGADSGTVTDPLTACNEVQLYQFVKEVIQQAKATVNAISFDIEGEAFRKGELDNKFYRKIGSVMCALKGDYPGLETNVIISQRSKYWKGGYNDALHDFFEEGENIIDYFYAMTSTGRKNLLESMKSTMSHLPKSWPTSKTVIFLTKGATDDPSGYATFLKSTFTDYAGISTLLTDAAEISKGNAALYKKLNGGSTPQPEPDNLIIKVENKSVEVGINVIFEKNDDVLFKTDYLEPKQHDTYDKNTPLSTQNLMSQDMVIVKFEYWGDRVTTCPQTINFNKNTVIRINMINIELNEFKCDFN